MLGSTFLAAEHCFCMPLQVIGDLLRLWLTAVRSRCASLLRIFRKQLVLFQERKIKPRRADDPTRWIMAHLSCRFSWRGALVNVEPDMLARWHRQGFRLCWRAKSQPKEGLAWRKACAS